MYYYSFLLLLKGKDFLIKNKVFFIISSLKSIKQKIYYVVLNYQLKFVSFEFKINNLLTSLSKNKFVLAFIILIISFILIIKFYDLVKKILKLQKFVLYLKKHQKLEKNFSTLTTLKSNYQLIYSQLFSILIDLSHLLFLVQFLASFFDM